MTRALGVSNDTRIINVNNLTTSFIELEDFAGVGNQLDLGVWGNSYVR